MISVSFGAAIGGLLGDKIESWTNKIFFLERQEALDYLFEFRNKNHNLSNTIQIEDVLNNGIAHFDRYNDGRMWYVKDDLKRFAKNK